MTRHYHSVDGKSRTQQSDAEQNDLNKMAAKHLSHRVKNGDPNGAQPVFGYVPSETYHEMLNRVTDTQNAFNRLPARVRTKFHNDPAQMLRFVEDKRNYKEARKMGLIDASEAMEAELREAAAQIDLVDKAGSTAPVGDEMPKADDEAQPRISKPATLPKGG